MYNYFSPPTGGKSFIDDRSTVPGADKKQHVIVSTQSPVDVAREQMQLAIDMYSKSKTKVTVRRFSVK